MRIGPHENYTRMVFDFPRVTAYYAEENNGDLVLTFDTPQQLDSPAGKSPSIIKIDTARGGDNTTKMTVDLQEGATFKHYRLMRKVIVDIYPPAGAVPPKPIEKTAEQKPADKPVETAEKKEPEQPIVEKKAEMPPPATSVAAEVKPPMDKALSDIQAAAPVTEVIAEKLPVPEGTVSAPQEDTHITISTVSPARMAVFVRYDTLWIVLDTPAVGAIMPDVKGPFSGLLGQPKMLKFDGGTAYRYLLPAKTGVRVTRKSLTWDVALTHERTQAPTKSHLNVSFDNTTRKAKLMAELKSAGAVLSFEDPAVGDRLFVVPAASENDRIDQPRRFSDVEIIPAAIGMVVKPLKDNVRTSKLGDYITVSSPDGIIATPGATAGPVLVSGNAAEAGAQSRLFDFPNWRMGGIAKLNENRRRIEQSIAEAKTPDQRSQAFLKLALLFFANNLGPETLGILRLIAAEDPEMVKNPNFIALRGAASALAGHYTEAMADLSTPAIQHHPEVNLWIGYAAAATEQWRMAERSFPSDNTLLTEYPQDIALAFTVYMAESALRLGHTDSANTLLQSLDTLTQKDDMRFSAAIEYLKGEAARQEGRHEDAEKIWTPVAHGIDRLYHTKAALALANLQVETGKKTLKEAINDIDNLRFAWRGDGLEVQILSNLGRLKIENGQYLSGLQDLKAAVGLAETILDDPTPIRERINRTVTDLFSGTPDTAISPLEAVAVYNEFKSSIPAGMQSTTAALNFTDYLVSMDLLPRAQKVLEAELEAGIVEEKRSAIGNKLAALYLLDAKPADAIAALDKTGGDTDDARKLLRARALSQQNQVDQAIAVLSSVQTRDAQKLKADVLWRARQWPAAAQAIEALLLPPGKAIDDEQARLVINAAVAHKLAGNDAGLMALKNRYGTAISTTPLGPAFGVVTRDAGASDLGDRETILKMASEVDMFKGFLDSYKTEAGKGS